MEINIWKVLTILFGLMLTLETTFIVYAWNVGGVEIEKENVCAFEMCNGYPSYFYDINTNRCYCFDSGGSLKVEGQP